MKNTTATAPLHQAIRGLTDAELAEVESFAPMVPALAAEVARRAEVRLVRGEFGSFDAAWYESRPVASCPDCGHGMHHEALYQRCQFNVGLGECNCQCFEVLA